MQLAYQVGGLLGEIVQRKMGIVKGVPARMLKMKGVGNFPGAASARKSAPGGTGLTERRS